MPSMIYTTGYTGKKAAHLPELLARLNPAVLVDIRFSANSRHAQWTRAGLVTLLGEQYEWLPAFGNRAYKSGRIELADPERGLRRIQKLAQLNYTIILMCGCKDYDACHRKTVAQYLMRHMEGIGYFVADVTSWEPVTAAPSLFERGM